MFPAQATAAQSSSRKRSSPRCGSFCNPQQPGLRTLRYNRSRIYMQRKSPAAWSYALMTLCGILLLVAHLLAAHAQQPAQPQQPDDVPVTDAQSGPCSIELTVAGTDAKPVYAARIDYHTA